MASSGSAAVAEHIRRRGVFGTQQLSGLQDNAILQVALAGRFVLCACFFY